MEDSSGLRRKPRPAQQLYVPPAQRNQIRNNKKNIIKLEESNSPEKQKPPVIEETKNNEISDETHNTIEPHNPASTNETVPVVIENIQKNEHTLTDDEKVKNIANNDVVIMLSDLKTTPSENEEDPRRDVNNVNKKIKPLIKHISTNDVLKIDAKHHISNKSIKKSPVKLVQVANWEDLFLEDEQEDNYNDQLDLDTDKISESDLEDAVVDPRMQELEHVIEVYDFPSTFKTQDIMQIYSHINKESMYVKWCDETHALLVLGSSIQAQRALQLRNAIIKSRPMMLAGSVASQVAAKCDLKPAMKRPETSMTAARRMITTALGAKNTISKEVQQKEREALRKAKELKRTQRQNERDAWEGNPRPSTA